MITSVCSVSAVDNINTPYYQIFSPLVLARAVSARVQISRPLPLGNAAAKGLNSFSISSNAVRSSARVLFFCWVPEFCKVVSIFFSFWFPPGGEPGSSPLYILLTFAALDFVLWTSLNQLLARSGSGLMVPMLCVVAFFYGLMVSRCAGQRLGRSYQTTLRRAPVYSRLSVFFPWIPRSSRGMTFFIA